MIELESLDSMPCTVFYWVPVVFRSMRGLLVGKTFGVYMMMNDPIPYKIPVDGKWGLEDLYIFPRVYEQVYYLVFSFFEHSDEFAIQRFVDVYSRFPWQGGFSAVNFYDGLKHVVKKPLRPRVLSIQYASPGWIELSLAIGVAIAVQRIVVSVCKSIREVNSVYGDVYRGLQERKLLRFKVESERIKLENEYAEYIKTSIDRMVSYYDVGSVPELNRRTGSPLKTIKILMSLHRRVRTLAQYELQGKTGMSSSDQHID